MKAALGKTFNLDQAGNHTRSEVFITDNQGKVHKRVGDGRQIGNFHPIFINWKGKKTTVEELLYESNQ
jgi:hypothetical protein